MQMLMDFLHNVKGNMFKPLLLFFYAGFAIPLLRVKFEFPKAVYQGLTIYLLLAIGWKGGEELASLKPEELTQALGFMAVGFCVNMIIGITAYFALRKLTRLRRIDAATIAGYYGSDSAGTFAICTGVLLASHIAFAPYMPVMLAVMEIPGCLVALFLVSKMRNSGLMDALGNMPGEEGYSRFNKADGTKLPGAIDEDLEQVTVHKEEEELVGAGAAKYSSATTVGVVRHVHGGGGGHGGSLPEEESEDRQKALAAEDDIALRKGDSSDDSPKAKRPLFSGELVHEMFLSPGIYLLFAGIAIGFIARIQGQDTIKDGDLLFKNLFPAILCLFLLEMGMTASRKLSDLKTAGLPFILFGLVAPNVFATFGMLCAHGYSLAMGHPLEQGTYVMFAVLCGAASYIALPAVQRMAIPEASPTLPLAASLGLTFSYNVTIGIPVYLMIAEQLVKHAAG